MLTKQNERTLSKLLRDLTEKAKTSWGAKCKLEYMFGMASDNDARNGENSGEPPYNQSFNS